MVKYCGELNGRDFDAYITREPDFCDIEEYTPDKCDACHEYETCEVYLERDFL